MTKDAVLQLLRAHEGAYISGAELAKQLSLSRTAVWKAIGQLKAEGYCIDSVTNRGYRLLVRGDVLSAESVRRYLRHREITPEVYKTISSTNTVLKARAAEGAEEGLALIAGEQTAGRGRMGRSFYSPADSGLYMSLLLRPRIAAQEAVRITACAAVAVAETIEELSGRAHSDEERTHENERADAEDETERRGKSASLLASRDRSPIAAFSSFNCDSHE